MLLKVKVFPDSYENKLEQTGKDTCEVHVRARAQNGHANKEATALLAKHFGKSVQMVSGGTKSHKIFRIG